MKSESITRLEILGQISTVTHRFFFYIENRYNELSTTKKKREATKLQTF